jgi:uncharacterized repeat protein (TIGR01451 family)
LGFSRRKPRARAKQRLLKLEPLENRQLLAVTLVQNYTIADDGSHLFEAPTTPTSAQITAASVSGTTVKITTPASNGFSVGESVTIAGVSNTKFDGTFAITAATSTTFTYTDTATNLGTPGTIAPTASASAWFTASVMNYTLTATNTGTTEADSVAITDDLSPADDGTSFNTGTAVATFHPASAASYDISTDINQQAINSGSSTTLDLQGSPTGLVLQPGDSITITFSATLASTYSTLSSVYNGPSGTYTDAGGPEDMDNSLASTFISPYPGVPDPLVNIVVHQADPVTNFSTTNGNTVTYEVLVTNNGPSDATNITLTDTPATSGLTIDKWEVVANGTATENGTVTAVGTGANNVVVDDSTGTSVTVTPGNWQTPPDALVNGQVLLNIQSPSQITLANPYANQVAIVVVATLDPTLTGGSIVTNSAYTSGAADDVDVDTDPSHWNSVSAPVMAPSTPIDVPLAETAFTATAGNIVTPGGAEPAYLYTLTVINNDPSTTLYNLELTDDFSSLPLTPGSFSWSASDNLGNPNSNTTAGTSPNFDEEITLNPGESMTYTFTGAVAADAVKVERAADSPTPTILSNAATLTMPSGYSDSAFNNATTAQATPAGLALTPSVDLTVTKTASAGLAPASGVTPGGPVTYTITVANSNSAPSDATNVQVTDQLGAGSDAVSWAGNGASGAGTLNTNVADLAPGASVVFTETTEIDPGATPNSSTADTATAQSLDASGTGSVATSSATVYIGSPSATLLVTKSDNNATTAVPGKTVTYTFAVSNEGPSDATNVTITDAVDGAIDPSSLGWSTTSGGTSTSSGATYTFPTAIAPGQTAKAYLYAKVLPSAAASLGLASTTDSILSVTDFGGGAATLDPASVKSVTLSLTPQADLGISLSDSLPHSGGIGEATPGGPITYTIQVTNNGPSDVTSATVSDTVPAAISGATLVSENGVTVNTPFVSPLTTAAIPAGGSFVCLVSGTISNSASGNSFSNTATVAPPTGVADLVSANNSATDTDALPADLTVTNTDSTAGTATPGTAIPGQAISYTLVVSNSGPAGATGATVSDTLPALTGLKLVSVTPAGSATSGAKTGSITSPFNDTVNLPAGGSITYVLSGTIPSSDTGTLSSTATVSPPAGVPNSNPNPTAVDSDNLSPQGHLQITKSASDAGAATGTAIPGTVITYTVSVSNAGPSDAAGVAVSDVLPGTLTGLQLKAPPGDTTASLNGSSFSDTVTVAAGASVTYVLTGTIPSSATGSLSNTASILAPAGFAGSTTSALVTDTLVPTADLRITKTDNTVGGNAPPGSSITYTIIVTNAGPSDVTAASDGTGATITDSFPAGLTVTSVTSSGANASGPLPTGFTSSATTPGDLTGLDDTVNMPAGSSVTYVVVGTISLSATGQMSNTATVTAPSGVVDSDVNANKSTNSTSATDTVTLAKADLVWSLSGQKTAVSGHDVIYVINVTNYGPGAAQTVTIVDTLPVGTTFVSATSSSPAIQLGTTVATASGTAVPFTGTIAVGASVTIDIDATVNSNVLSGKTLSNSVTVGTGAQQQTANNGHSPTGFGPLTFATQVNANGASVVPDMLPGVPAGTTDLVITDGPAASNSVLVVPSGSGYTVAVDGRTLGTFAATGRIIVYGDDSDYERISPLVKLSAWLYGGSGRDYLYGGDGNNVIIGGPGTNFISGGPGWNLLIGGGGGKSPNYIEGTTGNNIEISGTTSYDTVPAALNAILQEWASKDSYSVRADKITDTNGYSLSVNGSTVMLNTSTIQRVAAYEYLYGSSGQNLFFATLTGSQFDRDYVTGANNKASAVDWLELS